MRNFYCFGILLLCNFLPCNNDAKFYKRKARQTLPAATSLMRLMKESHKTCDNTTSETAIESPEQQEFCLDDSCGNRISDFDLLEAFWFENDDFSEEAFAVYKREQRKRRKRQTSAFKPEKLKNSTQSPQEVISKESPETTTEKMHYSRYSYYDESNYEQCPSDCSEVKPQNKAPNSYALHIKGFRFKKPFLVLCKTDGMIILRRRSGRENFFRPWSHYKKGFGTLDGDFFIGLEKLYAVTTHRPHKLGIIMEDFYDKIRVSTYDAFAIGSEAEGYSLKVLGKFSGTGGDGLSENAGMRFTTSDVQNDRNPVGNCAVLNRGAWWYTTCGDSNLFGQYETIDKKFMDFPRITWNPITGRYDTLKRVSMVLKPITGPIKTNVELPDFFNITLDRELLEW